jgi:hypothetical protein
MPVFENQVTFSSTAVYVQNTFPSPDFQKLNCIDERRLLQIPGKGKTCLKMLIFPGP